ncbi:DNA primase [Roseibaca ekhonensis]|uniref:DNA primase n=1 Tax=Roseinatronobacter ekhonensis TaxID=254356 RepID=A0A3B0M393_9RHOB|nr:DNA primase [Roseibaca ekhonensis]SUZ30612.1 DNA primase [Roseibaca ekhonensis]
MSLPPGFLDELRNRVSISSVVGRKVTWDMRKSNQAKGDFWAPCPFHQEKTASFHVDDRKGFYYCFGCHAKGDALTFLRETDNMSFMEAVEVLARDAGLPMPERDPRAAEKADHLSELAEVTEAAVRFFRMQLSTSAASGARDYLKGRGLAQSALDRFEIGYAPDARQALWTALTNAGVAGDKIIEAGLCAKPDDGGAPYDRMRGRIIFPIRDARGRCIGFGGRALSPNARAKYLNSPETPLFDKGRALYNLGPARSACGKGKPLIVAEGYMDVIALAEAGFEGAVAPLGTAITEDQLRLMWRVSPEPVIALDGDAAGLRAGFRLIDLALPLLGPEQSLRFCPLPEKMDPDDILRQGGTPAMSKLVDGAVPLVQLLWQRETEGQVFDSPERRAALDKRLRAALAKIADPGLRGHYTDEIKRLRSEFLRPARREWSGRPATGRFAPPAKPLSATRSTRLASAPDNAIAEAMREELIIATLLCHPALVSEFESDLDRLTCHDPALAQLCAALLDGDTPDDAQTAELLTLPHVAIAPPVRSSDAGFVRLCLRDEFAKYFARDGLTAELRDAVEDMGDLADEGVTFRLARAAEARNSSERARLTDSTDLGEDRAALSSELQRLIESEVWVKRKK